MLQPNGVTMLLISYSGTSNEESGCCLGSLKSHDIDVNSHYIIIYAKIAHLLEI